MSAIRQTLIWIPEVDENGERPDPVFVEAAYENQDKFFRYRKEEFSDPSVRANLLEKAVFRVSKARKRKTLEDPASYLFVAYSALVDDFLGSSVRLLSRDPHNLAIIADANNRVDVEGEANDAIFKRQLIDAMPDEARWIWQRSIAGFSLDELSKEVSVSREALNLRARRGAKGVYRRLFGHLDR